MAQRIMRHSSINPTMNLYTQLRVADEDSAMDGVAGLTIDRDKA